MDKRAQKKHKKELKRKKKRKMIIAELLSGQKFRYRIAGNDMWPFT